MGTDYALVKFHRRVSEEEQPFQKFELLLFFFEGFRSLILGHSF